MNVYICSVELLNIEKLALWYSLNFENKLRGRRILFDHIAPLINNLSDKFRKEIIGYSTLKIPIYRISIGTGPVKVLIWSQMHGNESTGTKALFDLFKFFETCGEDLDDVSEHILAGCTLEIITLLNPDGAVRFTRENADDIDLNRDAVDRKAVESRLLRAVLDDFNPKYCFNLHDQRSIFNVKGTSNPATMSFLAPSEDLERNLTAGRKETMRVIVGMNSLLQQVIPDSVGRYTDEFYPTATGDNFQKLGHNTVLFEAGHFKDDYEREITRKFNFFAILQGLYTIACPDGGLSYKPYFEIPNNDELFLDKIYKNIKLPEEMGSMRTDIGIQLKFKVLGDELEAYEHIEIMGNLSKYNTHNQINAEYLSFMELKLSNS